MRNGVCGSVLGVTVLLAACGVTSGETGPGRAAESREATDSDTRPEPADAQSQRPVTEAPVGEPPSEDLRSIPIRDVAADLPLGPPPRIPWSEPARSGHRGPRVLHPAVDADGDADQVAAHLRRPAGAPRGSNCWSLTRRGGAEPSWTRCYRWGKRPADGLYRPVLSPDGRWAVDLLFTGETVQLDARTGRAMSRATYGGRAQRVAFEDDQHYLVVLTDDAGSDAFPIRQWIVRCEMDGPCERATETVLIESYDQLGFPRSKAP